MHTYYLADFIEKAIQFHLHIKITLNMLWWYPKNIGDNNDQKLSAPSPRTLDKYTYEAKLKREKLFP